jgi:hypothetical protein
MTALQRCPSPSAAAESEQNCHPTVAARQLYSSFAKLAGQAFIRQGGLIYHEL